MESPEHVREPARAFARFKLGPAGPSLFGESAPRGERIQAGPAEGQPACVYRHPNGTLWTGDAVEWLSSLAPGSVDLIVADPPYSINKAGWDSFESQQAYVDWSVRWIEAAARALSQTGTLYVCGFSEILADLRLPSSKFFAGCRWIVWHYKNKANLRDDWGRSHESLLHLRKSKKFTFNTDPVRIPYGAHTLRYPERPQAETSQYGNGRAPAGTWSPNPLGARPKDVIEIPTTCNGMHEKTPHPTQKPEELIRRLVLASSHPGDLVVDPFFGSGTTPVVAEQLGRRWAACDLTPGYAEWAIERIEHVEPWAPEKWVAYDRANEERRRSIR